MRLLLVSFILGDSNWNFFQVGYPVDSSTNSTLKQTPFGILPLRVRNCTQQSAHYTNGRDWGTASKSGRLNCTNLTHFCLGLHVSCYSLLQYSRPAWLELSVEHMHTHSMNNLRWQLHWLPRLTSFFRESHVTDGEPETPVSASLQKRKSIKNQHKLLIFSSIFVFILHLRLVTHLSIISMVILHT